MAIPPITKALALGLAAGGLWWASARAKKRKKKVAPAPVPGPGVPACLENVWGPRQTLIPEIYDNINASAKSTADQFFGFTLTPAAQGALFEALAEIYVGNIETPTPQAAMMAMLEVAPGCEWGIDEWTETMADAMASTEALAMVVLSDIQDAVIPFEQPPVKIVTDPQAEVCVQSIYDPGRPLHGQIHPELNAAAQQIAADQVFNLTDEAQATAFLHLAGLAANDPDLWRTAPVISTLRVIAPACAWERKDYYTATMAEIWNDVELMRDIVRADIA